MSADTAELTKVDSAVSGLSSSPPTEKKVGHRRASSSAAGVYNINDLGKASVSSCQCSSPCYAYVLVEDAADSEAEKEGIELQIAKETQKLNWFVANPFYHTTIVCT